MRPTRDVAAAIPQLGHGVRSAALTGTLHIRWDASKIWLIPVEPPDMDPEYARLELGRRFLHWFGPATKKQFAWWAGVDKEDADATWTALGNELIDIDLGGEPRVLIRDDADSLAGAEQVEGVRLIPHGDPYIKIDDAMVVPNQRRRLEIFPRSGTKTRFWPVAGALLVNGDVVGSWARQERRVTVNPWSSLATSVRKVVEAEALALPVASSSKAQVRWVQK